MKSLILITLSLFYTATGLPNPPEQSLLSSEDPIKKPIILWIDGVLGQEQWQVETERERISEELTAQFPEREINLIKSASTDELKTQLLKFDESIKISHLFLDAHGLENQIYFGSSKGKLEALPLANGLNASTPSTHAQSTFEGIRGKFSNDAKIIFRSCQVLKGDIHTVKNRIHAIREIFGLKTGSIYANSVNGVITPRLRGLLGKHEDHVSLKILSFTRALTENSWKPLRAAIGGTLTLFFTSRYRAEKPRGLLNFYAATILPIDLLTTVMGSTPEYSSWAALVASNVADIAYLAYQPFSDRSYNYLAMILAIDHLTLSLPIFLGLEDTQNSLDLEQKMKINSGYLAIFVDEQLRILTESTYENAEELFHSAASP